MKTETERKNTTQPRVEIEDLLIKLEEAELNEEQKKKLQEILDKIKGV